MGNFFETARHHHSIRKYQQDMLGDRGAHLYAVQDTTIAAAYAQLAAVAAVMGSTWVGQFDNTQVHRALSLNRPSCLLPW